MSRTPHKGMPPAKVSDGIGLKPLVNGLCSSITWDDIEWMGTQTTLPLVLKGVGRAEDALRAADCPPVRGIVCSNHGGRNLDGGPSYHFLDTQAFITVLTQTARTSCERQLGLAPTDSCNVDSHASVGLRCSCIAIAGPASADVLLEVTEALRQAGRAFPSHLRIFLPSLTTARLC